MGEILNDELIQARGYIDWLEAQLEAAITQAEYQKRRTSKLLQRVAIDVVVVTFVCRFV